MHAGSGDRALDRPWPRAEGAHGEMTPIAFPFLPPERLKRVGVICHRHADPDAYMAAFAISRLMAKKAPSARVDVILPTG